MTKFLIAFLTLLTLAAAQTTPVYFAPDPGPAHAQSVPDGVAMSNSVVTLLAPVNGKRLGGLRFTDRLAQQSLAQADPFVLILRDGTILRASDLDVIGAPAIAALKPEPNASRASERLPGQTFTVELQATATPLRVTWRALLRDGANYIRQEVTLSATTADVPIAEVRLVDWGAPDARVVGTVKGSPIVAGDTFAGFEHPLSYCTVALGRARCRIERELPLKAGQSVTYSSVIGVAPPGQMRRAFLYYVERERAHPYRTFLHYNSWYDLGYFNKYDEAGALDRVNAFGRELHEQRGVTLSSYLFDDGWDDPATLWKFNSGFPDGFTKVRQDAEKYGAAPGVWMSPWGGYGKPRQERLEAGKAAGYEIAGNGFALSGPKYYQLFRDTCVEMMQKYGANQFKFDGTGNADRVVPGSQFDSDFDAAIHLIGELRTIKPDLYVNLTTGTYPSPFWLRYADSIWRGGEDHSFAGVGSSRERWITYRDADVYEHVVMAGPLYPLNSLMLHGLIYAQHAKSLGDDPQHDFKNEVRDYFGNGTQLQEMYITPSLLSAEDWDNLAEAAKWSRANAGTLVDTHWIGGDPGQLEVYGWASWRPGKGILVLRNPSDKEQSIAIDVAKAFELPAGAASSFRLHSPWKEDEKLPAVELRGGQPRTLSLKPFEVLVLQSQ